MMQVTFSLAVAAFVLLHVGGATTVVRRDTTLDVASAKYDSGGGGGYGGSGYSSGGGGGYGGGGGGGGYGGSGGGGGYGGSGGGGYGGGGGSYGGGGGYGDGGGGGGNSDTGNVYYYYYPASASSSNSYGTSSGSSYYGMSGGMSGGGEKDKDGGLGGILSAITNLATPAVLLLVLGLPILLLTLLGIAAALAFFIGRSNDGFVGVNSTTGSLGGLGGLVDLGLVRGVHEAFAAYQALTTDENCRQRVVCELGYILNASDKRATVVAVLDAMLPSSLQKHFKPLKDVMASGESGKCQKYVCNAAVAALKAGPLRSIFGGGSKGTTTTEAPSPGQDSETQHSPPETEDNHHIH